MKSSQVELVLKSIKLTICSIACTPILLLTIFSVNNKLIYWSLNRCDWPSYEPRGQNMTKVMFISDIHLRTNTFTNFVDNYIRERQMYYSYTYALTQLKPEFVFILGDILDDGERIDDNTFQFQVKRFTKLFSRKYSYLLYRKKT